LASCSCALLAPLPLPGCAGIGWALGWVLFAVVRSRRHVAEANLALCFPQPTKQRRALVPGVHRFAQAWLDRSWLWHAQARRHRARALRMTGDLAQLEGREPVVMFCAALRRHGRRLPPRCRCAVTAALHDASMPSSPTRWSMNGSCGPAALRQRAPVRPFSDMKPIVAALRAGEVLYLLPDMNFGPEESIFVPFYGVPAATVPSLSRFARLGRAKVVPVLTRITPEGYDVEVLPAWPTTRPTTWRPTPR
jgi:KDO2-lipid IV(A) lauroyltransferase